MKWVFLKSKLGTGVLRPDFLRLSCLLFRAFLYIFELFFYLFTKMSTATRSSTQNKRYTSTPSGSRANASRRLQMELRSIMASGKEGGVSAFPAGDNLMQWVATMEGPEGTPYDGLPLKLQLSFPDDYPYSAPTVTFTSSLFHPNVDERGNICLDILQDKWSAIYNVKTVLLSIRSLLGGKTELQLVISGGRLTLTFPRTQQCIPPQRCSCSALGNRATFY